MKITHTHHIPTGLDRQVCDGHLVCFLSVTYLSMSAAEADAATGPKRGAVSAGSDGGADGGGWGGCNDNAGSDHGDTAGWGEGQAGSSVGWEDGGWGLGDRGDGWGGSSDLDDAGT